MEVLSLLSPQQALADLVQFTQYIRKKYNCIINISDNNVINGKINEEKSNKNCQYYCPVIVVGGSYPGYLSAMARLRYPHVFQMAYAASAPITLYSQENHVRNHINFNDENDINGNGNNNNEIGEKSPDASEYAYYKVVTESAEIAVPGCAAAVRQTFLDVIYSCFHNNNNKSDTRGNYDDKYHSNNRKVLTSASCLRVCTSSIPEYIHQAGADMLFQEYTMVRQNVIAII